MHFTGKERDSESGNDNFGARYFGSSMGRFLSPDPSGISLANLGDPQQLNLYSYVRNNPLNLVDPTGLDCQSVTSQDGMHVSANCVVNAGDNSCSLSDNWCQMQYQQLTGSSVTTSSIMQGLRSQVQQSPQTPSPNDLVPANPCAYTGRALTAYDYASSGKASSLFSHPINFALDVIKGFPTGDYLDPQPLASGNVLQNAAYGNYAFGVYMAATHVPLSIAETGAAVFGLHHTYTSANGPRDPIFRNLPAANVANITNGFNAEKSGTLCHK